MANRVRKSLVSTTAMVTEQAAFNPLVMDLTKVMQLRGAFTANVQPEDDKPSTTSLDDATLWAVYAKQRTTDAGTSVGFVDNLDFWKACVQAVLDIEDEDNADETAGDRFPPDARIDDAAAKLNDDASWGELAIESMDANETAARWYLSCSLTVLRLFTRVPVTTEHKAAGITANDEPWYPGYVGPFTYSDVSKWPVPGSKAPKVEDGVTPPAPPANGYDIEYLKRIDTGKPERTSFTQRLSDMTFVGRQLLTAIGDYAQAGPDAKGKGGSGKLSDGTIISDTDANGGLARLQKRRKFLNGHMKQAIRVVSLLTRINTLPRVVAYIATKEIVLNGATKYEPVDHDLLFVIAERREGGLKYCRKLSDFLLFNPEKAIAAKGGKPEDVTVSDLLPAAKLTTGNGTGAGQGKVTPDTFKVTVVNAPTVIDALSRFVSNPTLAISLRQLFNNPDKTVSDPLLVAFADMIVAGQAVLMENDYCERLDVVHKYSPGTTRASIDVNAGDVKRKTA